MQYMMFSKPLGDLDVPAMCERMKQLGFSGVDLTVRKGGHVNTETSPDVARDLATAARQINDAGMTLPLITTNILSTDDPLAEPVFAAAAEAGVPYIKLGYWQYKGFGSFDQQLDAARRDLDGLETLASEKGVCAVIHNHSGTNHLTAQVSTVAELLRDRDGKALGAYVDAGHIFAEGIAGSWMHALDVVQGRIKVLGVKSYGMYPSREEGAAQAKWQRIAESYDKGIVQWRPLLDCLRQTGFDGPASFHCEYAGDQQAQMDQLKRDFDFFRTLAESL